MTTTEITIVKLDPVRVASAWGFGSQPEGVAAEKLWTWAKYNHMN